MIKNDREHSRKIRQLSEAKNLVKQNRELLKRVGLSVEEIEKHILPTQNLIRDLEFEIQEYENLKEGAQPQEEPIERIGEFLVKLRICKGLTQKALASKISVDETQVSRDERNYYKGVSLNRLLKVIEALDVKVVVTTTNDRELAESKS